MGNDKIIIIGMSEKRCRDIMLRIIWDHDFLDTRNFIIAGLDKGKCKGIKKQAFIDTGYWDSPYAYSSDNKRYRKALFENNQKYQDIMLQMQIDGHTEIRPSYFIKPKKRGIWNVFKIF